MIISQDYLKTKLKEFIPYKKKGKRIIMFIEELFKKQRIQCPEWLKGTFLEDEWEDSEYSSDDKIHIWTFKNPIKHLKICFDGTTYTFNAIRDNEHIILQQKTEGSEILI